MTSIDLSVLPWYLYSPETGNIFSEKKCNLRHYFTNHMELVMSPSQNNHKLSEGNSVAVAEAATSPPPAAPSPAGTGTVESAAMLMNSR